MSGQKELHYFTMDDWRERRNWYEQQFPDAPVRGESSPTYTMYPYLPSTAERIRELIPNAKVIYLVGDPLRRAIAGYVELVALRLEDRPIGEALTDFSDPANPHLCASRYASQIQRFTECFGPDRIRVVDQVDLRERRHETLREIFEFLEVDPDFTSKRFDDMHNTAAAKVAYNDLGYWLVKRRIFIKRTAGGKYGPLRQPLRALLSGPISRDLTDEERAALTAELASEVERLRSLTGKPFARWPSFAPMP